MILITTFVNSRAVTQDKLEYCICTSMLSSGQRATPILDQVSFLNVLSLNPKHVLQ